MGMGDVKYAAAMGLILGFPGTLIAFYLAFLTGAGISLILISSGKKGLKSTIPFGPFLAGATLLTLVYAQQLWSIFLRIVGL